MNRLRFATAVPVAFTHQMKFTARYIFMMPVRYRMCVSVCLMRTSRQFISSTSYFSYRYGCSAHCLPACCYKHTRKHHISRPDDCDARFVCRYILPTYIHCGKIHTLLVISVINFRVTFPFFFRLLLIYLFFFLRRLFIGTFVRSQINTHIDRHLRVHEHPEKYSNICLEYVTLFIVYFYFSL